MSSGDGVHLLCLTCDSISNQEFAQSPALDRMRQWQDKAALFWGAHPWFFPVLRSTAFWLSLAVLTAYYPEYREFSAVFVFLTAGVLVAREFLPLAPTPFNVYNVVSSRFDCFTTAALVLLVTLLAVFAIGLYMAFVEGVGNMAYYGRYGFKERPPVYWSFESLPWVSTFLLLGPLLFFSALAVYNRFVTPRLEQL